MNSFFNSPQAKRKIERLYQSKLDELCISYELMNVETSFGNTNIIITGAVSMPPLVLLHGSNGCAPVAIEAVKSLLGYFRVFAIDVIGQPNLSEEVRPEMSDDSYGKWMFEILSRLHIWRAILVGISFGGFISWKTLVFDERRISKAFLVVPAGIVSGNLLKVLWKVKRPMKLYKWSMQKKYVHRILKELFTDRDEFAYVFLSNLLLHFEMDHSPIPLITKEEAQTIKTPVHLIAADKDLLFPGEKMLKRASQIFPVLGGVLLLKNSKHIPGCRGNTSIADFIMQH